MLVTNSAFFYLLETIARVYKDVPPPTPDDIAKAYPPLSVVLL